VCVGSTCGCARASTAAEAESRHGWRGGVYNVATREAPLSALTENCVQRGSEGHPPRRRQRTRHGTARHAIFDVKTDDRSVSVLGLPPIKGYHTRSGLKRSPHDVGIPRGRALRFPHPRQTYDADTRPVALRRWWTGKTEAILGASTRRTEDFAVSLGVPPPAQDLPESDTRNRHNHCAVDDPPQVSGQREAVLA